MSQTPGPTPQPPAEVPASGTVPHPEVAAATRACHDALKREWLVQVREEVPATRQLNDEETINNLANVLNAIAEALATPEKGFATIELIGGTHGVTRFHQKMGISDLAREYPLLRQVMVGQIRHHLGRSLTPAESDTLHGLLDRIIHLSVAAYTVLQEKEIRLEAEATGQYLAMLSHDLRNTLNAAMLSMQMLQERVTELQAQGAPLRPLLEDLEDSRRMAAGAVDMMTRLLQAERLRAGEMQLQRRTVALMGLLESIRTAAARAAGQRYADGSVGGPDKGMYQIDIDCPQDATVYTDRDLLSAILQNLVGNAIRYAGDAPIQLVARPVTPPSEAAGGWQVQVIDNGPGIAHEQLVTLFRPFRRGQSSEGGTGLGLFISRRAADLLGAKLEVSSVVDQGTIFTLTLPGEPPDSPSA